MISGIDNKASSVNALMSSVQYENNVPAATSSEEANEKDTANEEIKDVLEISDNQKNTNSSSNYTKMTAERSATLERLKSESEARIGNFKQLVEKLISKQATSFKEFFGDDFFSANGVNLKDKIASLNVDAETKSKAQAAIGEDGEFGVEKTSQRIVDFAKALIGDDMSKFDKIKDAIVKGFDAAERAWGGELPEISKQTYDAVMSKLDEWEKNGTTNNVASDIVQQATVGAIANK